MKCPKCQSENNANAKFCVKCGSKLETAAPVSAAQVCSKCGAALKPGAKFCTKCGTPNAPKVAEPEERTMFLYEQEQADTNDRTVVLDTGSIQRMPPQTPPPVVTNQDDIVPPSGSQEKSKKEKSGSSIGLIIAAAILGVAAIAGIIAALIFFLPRDNKPSKREEAETETQSANDEADANPMQVMLENKQYTELVDTLLALDDLEFYGDEDHMREYMRQALVGHMNTAISEAQDLANSGDFDGAFGKIDAEIAYRENLKGQGRVHPFTDESTELEAAKEQLSSQFGDYISQNTQAKAEQRDLSGMEALLAQASGKLSDEEYNRITVDAYYMYVIKMVDQMQLDGKSPYEIMSFIDSYFEKTNYHGYLMELWDNQNAQSGRVATWNASVTHANSNGYLLYDSNGRYINKSELRNFTQYELYLARWEIYARHNRIFVDNALNTYFSKYSWYQGTENFTTFDDSSLNEYEKGNIKTIIEYEKECGYR